MSCSALVNVVIEIWICLSAGELFNFIYSMLLYGDSSSASGYLEFLL